MFKSLQSFLTSLIKRRTPEEDYKAGRIYCESVLDKGTMVSPEELETLWAQSKTDRCFGGNGQFDRGIEDVLKERGYEDPEVW